MHTDVKDPHGQDLEAIIAELGLVNGEVLFSKDKVNNTDLAVMYNMADVTLSISDAEGFGLSTLESMSSGTPIIVTMTGGMQDQVTDGENWFGIGIEPSSKAIIGSQQVPFIYEDRLNKDDFLNALEKMYNMSAKERHELGQKAAEWSRDFFGFDKFIDRWDKLFTEVYEKNGSWDTRQNYTPYEVKVF